MPEPRANEEYGDFMNRCIPMVYDEEDVESVDQAIAICAEYWEQSKDEGEQ